MGVAASVPSKFDKASSIPGCAIALMLDKIAKQNTIVFMALFFISSLWVYRAGFVFLFSKLNPRTAPNSNIGMM